MLDGLNYPVVHRNDELGHRHENDKNSGSVNQQAQAVFLYNNRTAMTKKELRA